MNTDRYIPWILRCEQLLRRCRVVQSGERETGTAIETAAAVDDDGRHLLSAKVAGASERVKGASRISTLIPRIGRVSPGKIAASTS